MDNNSTQLQASKIDSGRNKKTIAAFVLGICSVVLAAFLSLIGTVCGIVGLIFGIKSLKSEKRTFALIGLITSCAGIILGIILFIMNLMKLFQTLSTYGITLSF